MPPLKDKMTVISYPIPAYANVPIQADYYQPRRFVISDITKGQTTLITTTEEQDYVVNQQVRILIPVSYGMSQINGQQALITSIPADDQVEVNIDSRNYDPFITDPFIADITNATQSSQCVLTADNSFVPGQSVLITDVGGMTELNNNIFLIVACTATTITLGVDSSAFTAYSSGGIASLRLRSFTQPQIISIGDVNSGVNNSSGRSPTGTTIPGSFINISPE
jgi:hypothetical protein